MALRILLADDDPLVREGLTVILSRDPGFQVVASVCNGADAVARCVSGQVDIALLDAKMPVMDGPAACERISGETETRCCILSTFEDAGLIERAVRAGARGYLLKGAGGEEIKQAIRLIAAGNAVFESGVFSTIRGAPAREPPDLSMLSEREREIVEAVARGQSNREISEALYLSEGTVKNYISSILAKLSLRQRTQIAVYYLGPGSSQ